MTRKPRTPKRCVFLEDKALRRSDILNAARRLAQRAGFDAFTMEGLAAEAKLAKGTLYLYFGTKEAVFFHLEQDQLFTWLAAAVAMLKGMRGADALANALVASIDAHPRVAEIFALISTRLENNVPDDDVLSFKLRLLGSIEELGQSLCTGLGLPLSHAPDLCIGLHALLIGCYATAIVPGPMKRLVSQDARLTVFTPDARSLLLVTLRRYLRGCDDLAAFRRT
jgi:AcrR family transcriptional regulator